MKREAPPMKVLLLVDDEPLARERLRALLMECLPQARILEATTGTEALAQVVTEGPGIVFLDIQMPGMSGLEVAQHLARIPPPPAVIFTTAYSEYALAAFEANAIDYLVKPIRRERLEQALAKAHSLGGPDLKALNAAAGQARTHLSAWHKGRMELLAVTEVLVLRADQKYVAAIHRGGTLLPQVPGGGVPGALPAPAPQHPGGLPRRPRAGEGRRRGVGGPGQGPWRAPAGEPAAGGAGAQPPERPSAPRRRLARLPLPLAVSN